MFLEYVKFFLVFILLLFVPGLTWSYFFFYRKKTINLLECFVFSAGLSFSLITFYLIALDELGKNFTSTYLIKGLLIFTSVPLILLTFPQININLAIFKKFFNTNKLQTNPPKIKNFATNFDNFKNSKKYLLIFLLLTLFSFLMSINYLKQDIVPNNTDLGHHLYWVETINQKKRLPQYNTSDVILGEHLFMFSIAQLSNTPVLSAFPVLVLSFFNFLSFFTLALISFRLFRSYKAFIITFFISATLYPISAPFMKFASDGVFGNVFGNFFITLIILALILAFKYQKSIFLAFGMLMFFTLLYTHHLSAFLLIFTIIFGVIFQLIFFSIKYLLAKKKTTLTKKNIINPLVIWLKLFLSPCSLVIVAFSLLFFQFIHKPNYIEDRAVKTVIQKPIKDTRQGISLKSFLESTGEWRAFLGILGILILTYNLLKVNPHQKIVNANNHRDTFNLLFLVGWIFILLLLSFYPTILKIDLPSRRVVNYLTLPLTITMAFFILKFLNYSKKYLKKNIFLILYFMFFTALFLNGLSDSLRYVRRDNQFEHTVQIYHIAQFLTSQTTAEDVILKDHAHLVADSFLKFFFLRGYDYLLSRTFNYKYEDPTKERENCTLMMTTTPDSQEGEACFLETKANFVILQKNTENFFFEKSENFSKIYESDEIVTYQKK